MPYTISHAAAVLPFSRWLKPRRLLSAAVIGSMVPDFGYLMPHRPLHAETHSLHGLFMLCLPVGLALYWLFQWLIKPAGLEALPDGAYARALPVAASARIGVARDWLRAAIGVLAGAITHLVWDGFTHEGARGVRMFPSLADTYGDVAGHRLVMYAILQQLSSLAGLAVVFWVAWRALGYPAPTPRPARRLASAEREVWGIAYPACALLASAVLLAFTGLGIGLHAWLDATAIAVLRGLAFAAVAVSVALRIRLARS
jgi:hypothetical protein